MNDPAEALRAIRATWDRATRGCGEACGMDVVERAYAEMQAAWFDELGVHIAVLGRADGE
ncbi:MAG TPA: hypothetical protein VFV67_36495 [Actinophytocola sp.]|uniref:hypothetical protein n=1 Tax=Actinophytocola sp. TaxID=1872138 RepID=UPI002DBF0203|nr:hypothetical protein [Actinophytocola sp.]HEU5476157.1 hypothetical protein [Actinophytocola sp.]